MYIFFALLVSFVVYVLVAVALRLARRPLEGLRRHILVSLLALVTALVVFNLASRAVGIDLGPGHTVSYSIPEDYVARGVLGVLALVPYALACLSPLLARTVLARR